MKRRKNKIKKSLHPVMTLMILCIGIIFLSGLLGLFNAQQTFNAISTNNGEYQVTTEAVNSMFNLRGLKYIFTHTVSNFSSFAVLPHLLIMLLGFGIMEKSGFLKTLIMLLTKKSKKNNVTFVFVLLCILASIMGDLSYIIFIPLGALLFLYGKRSPIIGIVTSFAALTCGSGINMLLTSIDSSLITTTLLNVKALSPNYTISPFAFFFINIIAIIIVSLVITNVSENFIAKKVPKYNFPEEELDDDVLSKKKIRGLLFSAIAGITYLIIFIYNIIPNLPFSGKLLDYSQDLYIDKLFSYNSFFSTGFVFVVTVLFIILGLSYGIGAKTIKDNKEFIDNLEYGLKGVGKTLLLIFAFSTFISIFKQTNIGNYITAIFTNLIGKSSFTGLPLVILLFLSSIITTLFLPNSILKWPILSSTAIPKFMKAGLSPEFCQTVFRLGESVTLCLTPIFAYFVVYMIYLEKYNQNDGEAIKISTAIKYQYPYALLMLFIYLSIIVIWYLIGLPLGVGAHIGL